MNGNIILIPLFIAYILVKYKVPSNLYYKTHSRQQTFSSLRCSLVKYKVNTLNPRQNSCHFPDNIFKCIFLNENGLISLKLWLQFVPKGPINNIPSSIGSDIGLALSRWQAIIWTNGV